MTTQAEIYEIIDEVMMADALSEALAPVWVTWTISPKVWRMLPVVEHARGRRYEVGSGARARRRRR